MVNEVPQRRPSIAPIAKRLASLDKKPQMERAATENPGFVENVIYGGLNELISKFNSVQIGDKDMGLMPEAEKLKRKLGDKPLPTIEELGAREFRRGLLEAKRLMEMGQDIKIGHIEDTTENKSVAIMSPSVETNDLALLVGTGAHLLEETMYVHLRTLGFPEWAKDEVLYPLEEMALLMHAETLIGAGHESRLFHYITTPPSLKSSGGMGWKKLKDVENFVRRYRTLHVW